MVDLAMQIQSAAFRSRSAVSGYIPRESSAVVPGRNSRIQLKKNQPSKTED